MLVSNKKLQLFTSIFFVWYTSVSLVLCPTSAIFFMRWNPFGDFAKRTEESQEPMLIDGLGKIAHEYGALVIGRILTQKIMFS